MKKHNKLLLVLLICIYSLPTNAKVFISEWNTEKGTYDIELSEFYLDSKQRIWSIGGPNRTALYLDPFTLKRQLTDITGIPMIEDPNGNIIFKYVDEEVDTKSKFLIYSADNKVKEFGENAMFELFYHILNKKLAFIDNYAFFQYNFNSSRVFYYMKYDTVNKNWYFDVNDNRKIYEKSDSVELLLSCGWVKRGREMIIPTSNKGLFAFNQDTKKYRYIWHPEFKKLTKFNNRFGHCLINDNNIITIHFLYDRRPAILRVYPDDSVKFFHSPYNVCEIFKNDTSEAGSINLRIDAPIIPINKLQDEFLFSLPFNLIYFSEKEGFKFIPKPAEVDTLQWSFIRQLIITPASELWIDCFNGSVIRCNLDELLATRTEVFPGGLADATTEDLIPGVPVMSIYKVQPQPAKDYVDCSYFVQEGKFGDISVKIFDAAGKEYKSDKYEVIAELGVSKTLRVYAKGLPAGTYIMQIQDGANTASEKFIKE